MLSSEKIRFDGMGYGIYIIDPETEETLHSDAPHGLIGSTYCPGDTELRLSITYNYSAFYYREETLGVSTVIYGDKPIHGALPVLHDETGGIPGLQYISIPQARERVTRAINNLRDEWLDADGKTYNESEPGYYYAPTEANARRALIQLASLLLLAPDNAKIEVW